MRVCFGTVFGINSNLCCLPLWPTVSLEWFCQRLGQSQLEAAYGRGEVTEVGEEEEVVGCDRMV